MKVCLYFKKIFLILIASWNYLSDNSNKGVLLSNHHLFITDIKHFRSLKIESTIGSWKENRKQDLFIQQMTTASMKFEM